VLPPPGVGEPWDLVFDTAESTEREVKIGETYPLQPCSMVVLQSRIPQDDESKTGRS
jgi:hypothetical protein